MNQISRRWMHVALAGLITVVLSGPLSARDPGLNQPGAIGGTAGVGAPGVGVRDPGFNQPGALGNVGVGAPGVGVRDPGFNQPGAIGNTGPARRSVRP